MPVYKWRRRRTKHFGEVFIPFAQVRLQGPNGSSRTIAFQVDSGAVVTLLGRSVAGLLGIELESGRKIDLSSVGQASIAAYVHTVVAQFAPEWSAFPIPVAFAATDSVPNLLGRVGVFDCLQIDMDSTLRETRFSAKWLDEQETKNWDTLIEAEDHILRRLPALTWSNVEKQATSQLLRRASLLTASLAGLAKLHRTYAAPLFVRAIFETAAQFEYMLMDFGTRAKQYVEFEHVTRKLQIDAFLSGPKTFLYDSLRASPMRPQGQLKVDAEFARVESNYRNKNGNLHKNWYCIQFRQLAEALPQSPWNWIKEHEIWYAFLSAWAHSDPLATVHDAPHMPRLQPAQELMQCYTYLARMLIRTADVGKIVLSNQHHQLLTDMAKEF